MRHVRDGAAALDYLYQRGEFANAEQAPLPDVVLLDLRLPKVNGLDVLKSIREDKTLHQISVAILTTSAAESDLAKAEHLHSNKYFVKPLSKEMWMQIVADLRMAPSCSSELGL